MVQEIRYQYGKERRNTWGANVAFKISVSLRKSRNWRTWRARVGLESIKKQKGQWAKPSPQETYLHRCIKSPKKVGWVHKAIRQDAVQLVHQTGRQFDRKYGWFVGGYDAFVEGVWLIGGVDEAWIAEERASEVWLANFLRISETVQERARTWD